MRLVLIYIIGVIFGTGIVLGGMANPAKIINFFDIAGQWDPSLAFVMGGALVVTGIGYRLVFGRGRPIYEAKFSLPTKKELDMRLIGGSAVFGVGWGIAGFCPGGALPALGTGRYEVFVFVAALIAGIYAAKFLQSLSGPTPKPAS